MDRTIKTPKTSFQEMAPRNTGATISKRDLTNLDTPKIPITKMQMSDGSGSGVSDTSNNSSTYDEKLFIYNWYNLIKEYDIERFEYKNLPSGLTKNRIENKLSENGQVVLFKILDEFYVANFIQEAQNMYGEPTIVRIVEIHSPNLNNKVINLNKGEGVIIRNNVAGNTKFFQVIRFLQSMEKVLFQLEKNITRSAPKILVDTNKIQIMSSGPGGVDYSINQLEDISNSEDTAFAVKTTGNSISQVKSGELPDYYPLELQDKTEELWKNYNAFKQQLEELVGVRLSGVDNEKAERKVKAEISQHFSVSSLQHAFNTRKEDFDKVNKKYGTNIIVEYQKDIRPEDEDIQKEVKDDIQ